MQMLNIQVRIVFSDTRSKIVQSRS